MTIFEIFEMLGVEGDTEHPYQWIDNLIHNSSLPDEIKADMEDYNNEDCPEEIMVIMIQQLLNNQKDPVLSGQSLSQMDIVRHLRKIDR